MYQRTALPNNLQVLTSAMPQARSVAISVYVGTGSRYEQPHEAGISHLLEHLCFKGTSKRPTAREIAETIDGVGGLLNGATDRELTVYYATVAGRNFDLALDVLVDMVRSPILEEAELEKERQVVLEELAAIADSPSQLVDLLIDATLWPNQPLGRDIGGTKESVLGISREMSCRYLQQQYVPNNIVIAVAGDPQATVHQRVADRVWQMLGQWAPGKPTPWIPATASDKESSGPVCKVQYKKTEQAHLSIAFPGLPTDHPDRSALSLLSVILGEGMSSRLFLELREKYGLAYDIHSYVTHFSDTGAFTTYAAVDPKNAAQATQIILSELAKVRDELVGAAELIKVKEMSQGRLLLRLEDSRAVSGWIGSQQLLQGKVRTPEQVLTELGAVTSEDIRRVAKTLLDSKHLHMAIVGPFRSNKRFLSLLEV